jgi:hypothetical protein
VLFLLFICSLQSGGLEGQCRISQFVTVILKPVFTDDFGCFLTLLFIFSMGVRRLRRCLDPSPTKASRIPPSFDVLTLFVFGSMHFGNCKAKILHYMLIILP